CVAMALLVIAATGVAQLFGVAIASTQVARLQTSTTVLAGQKGEAPRAAAWADAAAASTPEGALDSSLPGSVEQLSARGTVVSTTTTPPLDGRFIRRWSIRAMPEDSANSLIVQVLVTTVEAERSARQPRQRMAGDA